MAETKAPISETVRKVAISGAFDPLHFGHLNLIKSAAALGKLTIILKGDQRMIRKKGYFLMPAWERAEILRSLRPVAEVMIYDTPDDVHQDDFSGALEILKPDIYCGGADKDNQNEQPQVLEVCERLGIKVLYGVGGDKIRSSSELLKEFNEKRQVQAL